MNDFDEIKDELQSYYSNIREIGNGGYSKVYCAVDIEGGEEVAIKIMDINSKRGKQNFLSENKTLTKLKHFASINQLKKSFWIKTKHYGKFGCFVLEKMDIDLLNYILMRGKIEEDDCKLIFRKICEGIKNCHTNGIAHLDLKSDNILLKFTEELDENNRDSVKIGDVQICDFGFSKRYKVRSAQDPPMVSSSRSGAISPRSVTSPRTLYAKSAAALSFIHSSAASLIRHTGELIGTLEYRSPEVNNYHPIISLEKADIWSLGVILFTAITGFFPFSYDADEKLTNKVDLDFVLKYTKDDKLCYNLLCKLLNDDFKQRPNIFNVLNDPWFSS